MQTNTTRVRISGNGNNVRENTRGNEFSAYAPSGNVKASLTSDTGLSPNELRQFSSDRLLTAKIGECGKSRAAIARAINRLPSEEHQE